MTTSSLQQLLAFAQTARHGSFAAAARELGGAPSTLAKSVARLETALGVKLFHRTTRHVRLTADGERLYHRCERVLAELDDLQSEAAGVRSAPAGPLRIDVSACYGRRFVLPLLADLGRAHPGLVFEVRLHDGIADMVRDGIDVAVRAGPLDDSTLVARRVDEQQLRLVASPAYLARAGTPSAIETLAAHAAIVFRLPASGRNRPWQLRHGRRLLSLHPTPAVQLDDTEALADAARLGFGLCQLPDYVVREELAQGTLVELLPELRPPPMPISAVMPTGRLVPQRVHVLLQALDRLRERARP